MVAAASLRPALDAGPGRVPTGDGKMPYLIDGNNLIGAIRIIDIRDASAREKMTRMLAGYQQAKRNLVVVVYDGPPPS